MNFEFPASTKINRIAVIGNACCGKTALSRRLASSTGLPVFHIDSIQFLSGMILRDPSETRQEILSAMSGEKWIIDGLGPLNILEKRLMRSDLVICIKLPLWQTYWFMLKRQIKGIFVQRQELPKDCREFSISQTKLLVRSIWNVHHGLWPQLLPILEKPGYREKVILVKSLVDLNAIK